MRHGIFVAVLVSLLLVGSVAFAEGPTSFEVNGDYWMADCSIEGLGVSLGTPGFVFGGSVNLTDAIGARFRYANLKFEDVDWTISFTEILGSYKVMATELYTLSALAGWDAEDFEGSTASGIVLGGELTAPVSEMLTVRGSLLYAPSYEFEGLGRGTATRLELAGAFAVPQSPVKVEVGYRSGSDTYGGVSTTINGMFVGARATF